MEGGRWNRAGEVGGLVLGGRTEVLGVMLKFSGSDTGGREELRESDLLSRGEAKCSVWTAES
jgi:hypothetical protein